MKHLCHADPELQPILAASQPWTPAGIKPPALPHRPGVERQGVAIPGPDGTVPGKLYLPENCGAAPMPALLWLHGGGYVAGDIDTDDPLCEMFALEARCVVLAADYRLALQAPYPAALRDGYAALCWLAGQAGALNLDPSRLAIAGASAGGGLAAALALLARDRGGPALCFQMPLYPMLDDTNTTPSSHEITEENFPGAWNRTNNRFAWGAYLRGLRQAGEEIPCYAAPTRARDLGGLPPAYTCIGTLDLFRDEVLDYFARLARADVPVELHLYPGAHHGFESPYTDTAIGRRCRAEYTAALRRAFWGE